MLETLTNLRNNKIKPSTGPAADAESALKKYIGSVTRKSGVTSDPLRLSLEDLRQSESKGKWWLVGAAWAGNPLVDRQAARMAGEVEPPLKTEQQSKDAALIKLAKKQGMNTDVRRQIFVAIMGAEDYLDAAERINRLKLTEIQQREVVRVLLHCLGNVSQGRHVQSKCKADSANTCTGKSLQPLLHANHGSPTHFITYEPDALLPDHTAVCAVGFLPRTRRIRRRRD